MKLSLVVAQGVHAGKKIPVSVTAEFIIGRDANCQLRPASPSISKQHCAIAIRGEQVFVRDCGSTNGTFVNDEQIAAEREIKHGDKLRAGPLEFTIDLEATSAKKLVTTETVAAKATETVVASKPAVIPAPVSVGTEADAEDSENMAAMLLGFDDGSGASPTVENFNPDNTTVMEMPALGAQQAGQKTEAKKEERKTHADSSSAAAEALSKYMRRPRT